MNLHDPSIQQFLEDLALTEISDEQKEELLKKMDELISEEVMIAILDTLSEEQNQALMSLMENTEETKRAELANQWLRDNVPNLSEITEKAIMRFSERLRTANGALLEAEQRTAAGLNPPPTEQPVP